MFAHHNQKVTVPGSLEVSRPCHAQGSCKAGGAAASLGMEWEGKGLVGVRVEEHVSMASLLP